ncbi:hypothetical protein ACFWH4_10695 [Streptomyces sp. NPDC127091]|uniref:hypothetical protein n=1 Tax=Streptomyces sp. NPDC127091 TaxID=3347134 RepID=UPI0036615F09
MPDRPDRRPRRLTVPQAAAVLLLAAHGSVWLAVAVVRPSLHALLVCLSGFGAALATLALVLAHGHRDRP